MANLYKDKEGHFTSKDNDGGECKHNTNFMSKEDKDMLGIKDNSKQKTRENFQSLVDEGWEKKDDWYDDMYTKLKGTPYEVSIYDDNIGGKHFYRVSSNNHLAGEKFDTLEDAKKVANEYVNAGQKKIDRENNKWNTSKFKKGDYVKVTGGKYANFPMLQQIEDFILDDDNEEGGTYLLNDVEGEGSVFNPRYRGKEAKLQLLPSSLELANEDEYADDPEWKENKRLKHNPRYKYVKAFISRKFKQ